MSEPDDPRLRFGMDPPRLEEQRYWEELTPGADEVTALKAGATNELLRDADPSEFARIAEKERGQQTEFWWTLEEPRTVDEDGDA